tara:strand:+ start:1748 stop:2422 length:675 start_codon:yes stop_codon:yes gene_type:complete
MKTKKKLFIWLFIFIFLSTYSLDSAQKNFFSILQIKNINIEGTVNVNKFDLKNKLNQFYGESLIFLNRKKLNQIGSEFSFIKEIKIKKIYPDTLNIIVKENKQLGILIENDKKVLLLEMGNEISNFTTNNISNLLIVKGKGAKKQFHKFYKILERTNFEIGLIQELNYFKINRWDIVLKDGKIVKLPTKGFEKSIEKFITIYEKDNFSDFKIFDFRIKKQIILE